MTFNASLASRTTRLFPCSALSQRNLTSLQKHNGIDQERPSLHSAHLLKTEDNTLPDKYEACPHFFQALSYPPF